MRIHSLYSSSDDIYLLVVPAGAPGSLSLSGVQNLVIAQNAGEGCQPDPANLNIGPKTRNQPRMTTAGRSTDRAVPMLNPTGDSEDSDDHQEGFACRFPGCDRVFPSAIGRGVHERRAHPDWNDARRLHETVPKKGRWTEEERRLLARKEAEILSVDATKTKSINQELCRFFDGRTLESIKGQRKRTDYKEWVEQYKNALTRVEDESSESAGSSGEESRASPCGSDLLSEYFATLQPLKSQEKGAQRLNDLCRMPSRLSKDEVALEVALFLKEVFPCSNRSNICTGSRCQKEAQRPASRKIRRRAEYARVQDLWRKSPSKCAKRILEDQLEQREGLPQDLMEPFWTNIMTTNKTSVPDLPTSENDLDHLWGPITPEEVKNAFPPAGTAAGPDGISSKAIRKFSREWLARLFNIFMWCGRVPEDLCLSRTVLLPKKKDAVTPGDYRPITVSSVLLRVFHKVLAARLNGVELDPRQRAFRPTDGCSDNIMLLDMILRYHHTRHKNLFVATLDMAKAFDSVSFPALERVMASKSVPRPMRAYIMNIYSCSKTILQHGGWSSEKVHPLCGVKQGDPLSPTLFNFVIDEMLRSLPSEVGVDVGGIRANVLAFADDLVLVASTQAGLQALLNQVGVFLRSCGLEANASKCSTIAIRSVPGQKRTVVDAKCSFTINGRAIPPLKRTDEWRYLGVRFTADGRVGARVMEQLELQLERLAKAPLKPQQRLWALRVMVIPGLLYRLTLGKTTFGYLRSIDKRIRRAVRDWLHLPHESPNGYFHARVADGGLGIPSVRWRAPLERLNRLRTLRRSAYIRGAVADDYLDLQISEVEKRLRHEGQTLDSARLINTFWARSLYSSYDGNPLKESANVPFQHSWLTKPTKFLRGRDFVMANKARINALPTRSRTGRGRARDRFCRAGCQNIETANHCIQQCFRTHDARIRRHDAIVKFLRNRLGRMGFEVEMEPRYQTDVGLRKPDLVATLGATTLVIDAQVVSEQVSLDDANARKIRYYRDNKSLLNKIRETRKSADVKVLAATINWRGVWSKRSAQDLMDLGVLRKDDISILSSRVIIGALAAWSRFNQRTSVQRSGSRRRAGVG